MKKFFMFLIIFLFIPIIAFAQSRQEMAVGLAKIFDLRGDLSGLYYYNDWQKIDKGSRAAVSQCAALGLFQPERGEYLPSSVVGNSEKNLVASGLDKFIFLSSKYDKAMGVVEENSGNVRITLDNGGKLEVDRKTAFLGSRGVETCEDLKAGQRVNLCVDSANKVYIVWAQKETSFLGDIQSYEVVGVRQGELYLWDLYEKEFIFKFPMRLRFGNWQNIGGKYDNLYVHEDARVYLGNERVAREDINKKWLDRRANYIVGRSASDGAMRILHIEFE